MAGVIVFGVREDRVAWASLYVELAERAGRGIDAEMRDMTAERWSPRRYREGRLCQLVRENHAIVDRTLETTFLEPGAEAYAFTFG
jgi:hypothetical protein